jgi:hypothetical protein
MVLFFTLISLYAAPQDTQIGDLPACLDNTISSAGSGLDGALVGLDYFGRSKET